MATKTDSAPVEPVQETMPEKKHGPLYWFAHNILGVLLEFAIGHKVISLVTFVTLGWFAFVFRAYWQPAVVIARIHSPEIIILMLSAWALRLCLRRRKFIKALVVAAFVAAMVLMQVKMDLPPLRHVTLYLRYIALNPVSITQLPITDHERIQPLNSVRVLGGEAMKEVEQVSEPHFVRVASHGVDQFRWTLGIEPAYHIPRFMGHVKEVLDVSGLASQPNFSGENRIPVSFRVGEGLLMGKKTGTSAIRSLGLLRFFSYSPRDVRFMQDDQGKWVQVVSLIRWRGIFFVWPEYGGVQVIHQQSDMPGVELFGMIRSWFVGDGQWISPENVAKYAYLQEQNTLPYEVSRYMAMSLRFQNGFLSPLPFYHKGDIRIPDLPGDQNDQPFCVFFRFDGSGKDGGDNKLYHYFALEPFHDTKQGLNTSLFVPADGIGPVKLYQHYKVNEALTGVSAIAPKVMESMKQFDWEQSRPAEHRPYIRDIDGKRRFFWLTTVVTYKDKKHAGERGFIAGSTPGVTLTDALYKSVVWVNPHEPQKWPDELREKLLAVWKSN